MSGINNLPSGAGADSALAWFRRTLGDVIGLNPAMQDFEGDQLGAPSSPAQRAAIADLLDRRFLRSVDPASGRVSFETVGDSVLLAEPGDAETDPLVAEVAAGYLDSARAAIASIDPGLCRPGVCPDRLRDLLGQARRTIDLMAMEAPRRGSSFQVSLYIDELTATQHGLLPVLDRILRVGEPTVIEERAIEALRMAREAVAAFDVAVARHRPGGDESSIDVVEVVRRCAAHAPAHVERARRVLEDAGIGRCELETYIVPLGGVPCVVGGTSYDRVPLSEIMRTLKTEPARWPMLIGVGRPDQVQLVQDNARTLIRLMTPVSGSRIVQQFRLRDPAAALVIATIDRSWSYIASVFHAVAQEPMRTPPPRGARGKQAQSGPPAADQQPI